MFTGDLAIEFSGLLSDDWRAAMCEGRPIKVEMGQPFDGWYRITYTETKQGGYSCVSRQTLVVLMRCARPAHDGG